MYSFSACVVALNMYLYLCISKKNACFERLLCSYYDDIFHTMAIPYSFILPQCITYDIHMYRQRDIASNVSLYCGRTNNKQMSISVSQRMWHFILNTNDVHSMCIRLHTFDAVYVFNITNIHSMRHSTSMSCVCPLFVDFVHHEWFMLNVMPHAYIEIIPH